MGRSTTVEIRAFVAADYGLAFELWQSIEGLGLNESDTAEAVEAFLERNPGFSAIAWRRMGRLSAQLSVATMAAAVLAAQCWNDPVTWKVLQKHVQQA